MAQKGIFESKGLTYQANNLLSVQPDRQTNLSSIEAALITLGEATASLLHQDRDSQGFDELHQDVKEVGEAVGKVRQAVEAMLGHPIAGSTNFQPESKTNRQLSLFDIPF